MSLPSPLIKKKKFSCCRKHPQTFVNHQCCQMNSLRRTRKGKQKKERWFLVTSETDRSGWWHTGQASSTARLFTRLAVGTHRPWWLTKPWGLWERTEDTEPHPGLAEGNPDCNWNFPFLFRAQKGQEMEYPGHHSLCQCCMEITKLQGVLLKGTLKRKLTKTAPQSKQKLSKTCLTNYNRKFSQQRPLCKIFQKIKMFSC